MPEQDVPEQFGPYRLDRRFDEGGMGEVWVAFDTAHGRTVALKRLLPHLAADAGFRKRFGRESRLAAGLTHPHVLPIHEFGEIDGRLYLTMPLVSGTDLAELLRRGPLPPAEAVAVVDQVASALDAAHAAGLVHRDVKPQNVLITRHRGAPFAYLIDFGTARVVDGTRTITGDDVVVGTPAYMPPEQFDGVRDDPRLDVYALTCVLFEALTARRPFRPTGEPEDPRRFYEHSHRCEPRPQPSAARSGVPIAFDHVVASGMATQPDERCATPGELAALARGALNDRSNAMANDADGSPIGTAEGTPDGTTPSEAAEGVQGETDGTRGDTGGAPAEEPDRTEKLSTAGSTGFRGPSGTRVLRPRPPHRSPVSDVETAIGGCVVLLAVVALVAGAIWWWWPGSTDVPAITVGANPQAIVVDPNGRTAYVVNNGSDSVSVIDLVTNGVAAPVPVGHLPVAMAVSRSGDWGYVVNGGDDSVSVLDLRTRSVIDTVRVDPGPVGVVVDRTGARVYVAHAGGSVSVVDMAARRVVGSIGDDEWLPASVADIAISADGARVLVTDSRPGRRHVVRLVDTRTFRPLHGIVVEDEPRGVAISDDGRRAYVANSGSDTVSLVDLVNGTVETHIPVGEGPQDVVLSPDGRLAFVSNATAGTFTVVDTSAKARVGDDRPGGGPIAVSGDGRRVYVVDPASASVAVVNLG